MSNTTEVEVDRDYLDQLAELLPWQRSFTSFERLIIVTLVSIFVSFVGCALLCLICPQSPIRRRKRGKETERIVNANPRKSILIVPPPPSYDSIVKTDLNKLSSTNLYAPNSSRKFSNGTVSDSDGISSNSKFEYLSTLNGKLRSQSARSSLANVIPLSTISNTFPLAPYAQINAEFDLDHINETIRIHLTNAEHISLHPAFEEQGEFFIRIQLLNTKILKKCQDAWKKRRSSLTLTSWKKQQQEKKTKTLIRNNDDTLLCDEFVQFPLNKTDFNLFSLRFLLCSTDRSGIEDVMFESILPLQTSMIPHYEQMIEFKDVPQVTFAEVFLGLSYLPTAERLTINVTKFRLFCKFEKEKRIETRLIVTFFHHGRRFFQKKIPCPIDGSTNTDCEINDSIVQNIPLQDLQSVYVHLELTSKDHRSIFPSASLLIGKQTYYEIEWLKLLEQPRQMHLGWYPFRG